MQIDLDPTGVEVILEQFWCYFGHQIALSSAISVETLAKFASLYSRWITSQSCSVNKAIDHEPKRVLFVSNYN